MGCADASALPPAPLLLLLLLPGGAGLFRAAAGLEEAATFFAEAQLPALPPRDEAVNLRGAQVEQQEEAAKDKAHCLVQGPGGRLIHHRCRQVGDCWLSKRRGRCRRWGRRRRRQCRRRCRCGGQGCCRPASPGRRARHAIVLDVAGPAVQPLAHQRAAAEVDMRWRGGVRHRLQLSAKRGHGARC